MLTVTIGMYKVFIDGKEGTTGLKIFERMAKRTDVRVETLPEELRKDAGARKECINRADIVFLCLPDAAAKESVSLIENKGVRVIDASTAHRTSPDWAYGFPELSGEHRRRIAGADRVAVPGCHASGFISLVYPLIAGGFAGRDYPFVCHSVTGYSGGGKKMIGDYECGNPELSAPRQYGLTQNHKHLPEMVRICGLEKVPVFCPIVSDFYSGMLVTVPLFQSDIRGNQKDLAEIYSSCYHGPIVHFDTMSLGGMAAANALAGRDDMAICIGGNEERILLMAFFDNLGKGASGAAIQNMNIILGLEETTGLNIGR